MDFDCEISPGRYPDIGDYDLTSVFLKIFGFFIAKCPVTSGIVVLKEHSYRIFLIHEDVSGPRLW